MEKIHLAVWMVQINQNVGALLGMISRNGKNIAIVEPCLEPRAHNNFFIGACGKKWM